MTENQIGTVVIEAAIAGHRGPGPGLFETVHEGVLVRYLADRVPSRSGRPSSLPAPVSVCRTFLSAKGSGFAALAFAAPTLYSRG